MSYAIAASVTIETDSSGDAIGYTEHVTGRIINVIYTKDDYANGVDFVITVDETGQSVWSELNVNASKTIAPRQPTHDVAAAASLFDTVSNEPVEDYIVVANSRIKIVIDEGGDTLSGTFTVIMG